MGFGRGAQGSADRGKDPAPAPPGLGERLSVPHCAGLRGSEPTVEGLRMAQQVPAAWAATRSR